MNLQNTFPLLNFPPFPGSRSSDSFFDERRRREVEIPIQKFELLITTPVEAKSKENLILSWETLSIIGENGRLRFDEFKGYPDGWYGGQGRKLLKGSVANFERFIKRVPELKRVRPSVFLTLDGNISLGWEDSAGKSFEVEFFPDKVEYFIEKLNEESTFGLARIHDLADKIRGLI